MDTSIKVKSNIVVVVLLAAALCASALAQDVTPPTVADVTADGTALPGAVLTSAAGSIVVTFSEEMDASTVTVETVRLVRSGGDGTFGNGNEIEIVPTSVMLDGTGTQATMELTGVTMPNDDYQVTVGGGGPTTGLVAHWRFDETSGTTAYDSSGNGNHATLRNGPQWVAGKVGGALEFDGNDDAVEFSAQSQVQITVSAWVNAYGYGTVGAPRVVSTLAYNFCLTSMGPAITFGSRHDVTMGRWIAATSLIGAGWHHLAATYDGSSTANTAIIFLDGVPQETVETDAPAGALPDNAGIAYIGDDVFLSRTFEGLVDEVRIYGRVLTPSEVGRLASVTPPVTDLSTNPLDGEFTGSFPSGDGTAGGDFVCTFTIENVTPPASVADLSLSAGDESVTVAWRNPFDTDFAGVVVLRRVDADPTGTPTDGVSYDIGNALGDGFVVYVGTGTAGIPGDRSSWENTGLLNDTEYHYTIFAYDEAMNYSAGSSASAVAGASGGGDGGLCSAGSSASPVLFALAFALAALSSRLRGVQRGEGPAAGSHGMTE